MRQWLQTRAQFLTPEPARLSLWQVKEIKKTHLRFFQKTKKLLRRPKTLFMALFTLLKATLISVSFFTLMTHCFELQFGSRQAHSFMEKERMKADCQDHF